MSVKTVFSIVYKKLLCQFFGYFDGQLQCFVLDENNKLSLNPVAEHAKVPSIIIVGRSFYQEKALRYPIINKAELKKLLALEYYNNFESFYHIWGHKEQHSQVNIWQFDKAVPKTLLLMPESLLLAATAQEQIIVLSSNHKSFIARIDKLIHSLPQTAVINSSQRFAMSIGMAAGTHVQSIGANELATELAFGIKQLFLSTASSFIRLPKVENRLKLLKNITMPFFLTLGMYLTLSSGYLLYKQHSLQQQFDNQSEQVSAALKQQQTVDDYQSRYVALRAFLPSHHTRSALWLVLAELFPKVKLANIRIVDNRYIIRGQADKATEILQLISINERVKDAKFDFATQSNRNQENFVISFELSNLKGPTRSKTITAEKNTHG